jgi:opacity protein-like surface antigen/outer membrane receptor protein involved in Fe transport
MPLRARLLASASLLISSVSAFAQTPAQPLPSEGQTPAAQSGGTLLPTVTVQRPRPQRPPSRPKIEAAQSNKPAEPPAAPPQPPASSYETGAPNIAGGATVAPTMASQLTVSGEDVNARPITHPGEVVEVAPGLMAVMHADAGKANQYYLRGWNLDHGTDLATFWDDVPINLPTHAHGQGYTDLNWLIPETVDSVEVRKGPYWADVGDFENAGNLHISVRDSVDRNIESATVGSFGYQRYLALGSTKVDDGNLLYAGEFNSYAGPWTTSDDMKRFSGVLRYSQGTATDGFSLTGMAYTNTWNSTDQVALRAYTTGQIGLYGELDPTDGGDTSRFSLSSRMAQTTDDGSWKANAYLVKYTMDLWNNYTWFTDDPVNGDQFHQHDDRVYGGGGASRTFEATFAGLPTETVFGVQGRYDDITTALNFSYQRQLLAPYINDHTGEGNAAVYAENTVHWTDWLRTIAGWRGDYYAASVDSMLQPANSGNVREAIGSPKLRMVVGPFAKTELFFGAGMGYHSNDARSATLTEVPGQPGTPEGAAPFLVRSRGAEVGVRTQVVPGLDSSVSFFYIHQDSELFFDGDTGDTVAGLPSVRTGVEFTNNYKPVSWLRIDGDLALSRARFVGYDEAQAALYQSLAGFPQAQIGNAPGNYVYNAPWMVASAGVTLGEKTGWFSTMRWRYISSRPLTEDGVFQSPPLNIINAGVGYRFDNGWRIQLDALNLLDSRTDLATYAYGALLTTDAMFAMCYPTAKIPTAVCQNGVMDYIYHPVEPLAFRLTLAGPLETISTLDPLAMAAEMRRSFPSEPVRPFAYDWTGFSIGIHAGGALSRTSGGTVDTVSGNASAPIYGSPPDWHGGVQVGYDYMLPSRFLLGMTADVSSGGARTTSSTDVSGTSSNQLTVFDSESVRARFGYAVDNLLFYGTAGWAWSSNQYIRTQLTGTLNLATAGTEEAVNNYLGGWTAGAGVAYAFAQNWNAFVEYRRTSYGSSTITLPFSQLSTTQRVTTNAIDVGVNYKFDLHSSAAARSQAFDAYVRPVPKPVSAQPAILRPSDWSGFYVGGDGGFGFSGTKGTLSDAQGVPLTGYSESVHGPFAGVYTGGNYQVGHFVFGVEADWQWANLTGNNQQLAPLGTMAVSPSGPYTVSTTIRDDASVRGRFGFAFDRVLLFGTGGWAWGNPVASYALFGSAPILTAGGYASGWTAGAGIEYALTDNVLGRIEYRYTDLATPGLVNGVADIADSGHRTPISDARVGIAYKFGADLINGRREN